MSAESLGATHKLVFLHLPKTGGTTLHHHFAQHFAPEERCPERFAHLDRYRQAELANWRFFSGHFNADQLRLIPGPLFIVTVLRDPVQRILSTYYFWKRHSADLIRAHDLKGPAIARAGTLLEFLQSTETVVLDAIDNAMTRYLAGQVHVWPDTTWRANFGGHATKTTELQVLGRAIANLQAFQVFGDMSHLGDVYARVAKAFGMKPLSTLRRLNTRADVTEQLESVTEEEITPEVHDQLMHHTRLDRILYELSLRHLHDLNEATDPLSASTE